MVLQEADGWTKLPAGAKTIQVQSGIVRVAFGTPSVAPTGMGVKLATGEIYTLEYDEATEAPYAINTASGVAKVEEL